MSFIVQSNVKEVQQATQQAIERALEICGGMCESYAKDNAPVDTGNLRNSITHAVNDSENEVYIGTNTEYAPYIEYGTGIYAEQGGRRTPWFYEDDKGKGHFTHGSKPTHFLKKALNDHKAEYQEVINQELKNIK